MILIDTNIVSEAFKKLPDRNVERWFLAQPEAELFICTPVLAELHYGVNLLPDGKKKRELARVTEELELEFFAHRVLPIDAVAARHFGEIRALRYKAGRSVAPMDILIAAIARANSMTLATRNLYHFEDLGITLINPFEATAQ